MNKFKLYIKKDGSFFRYGVGSLRYIYGLLHDYIQLHDYDEVEFKIQKCDTKQKHKFIGGKHE